MTNGRSSGAMGGPSIECCPILRKPKPIHVVRMNGMGQRPDNGKAVAFFATLRETAEQLTNFDGWYRILSHALTKYLKGRQVDPPPRPQAA